MSILSINVQDLPSGLPSGSASTFFQPLSAPAIEPLPDAVQSYLCTYLSLDEFKSHFESVGITSPRSAALPLDPRLKPPLNSVLWGAARGAQDRLAFGLEALLKIPDTMAAGDESSLTGLVRLTTRSVGSAMGSLLYHQRIACFTTRIQRWCSRSENSLWRGVSRRNEESERSSEN